MKARRSPLRRIIAEGSETQGSIPRPAAEWRDSFAHLAELGLLRPDGPDEADLNAALDLALVRRGGSDLVTCAEIESALWEIEP